MSDDVYVAREMFEEIDDIRCTREDHNHEACCGWPIAARYPVPFPLHDLSEDDTID